MSVAVGSDQGTPRLVLGPNVDIQGATFNGQPFGVDLRSVRSAQFTLPAGDAVDVTLTIPNGGYPDTGYRVSLALEDASAAPGPPAAMCIVSRTALAVTVRVANQTATTVQRFLHMLTHR